MSPCPPHSHRALTTAPQGSLRDRTDAARSSALRVPVTNRIVADGGDPIASTPEEYAANIEREEDKWAAVIKKLGLKIE
jgi:tripartite-type tricarboxylate transporter receptor subunit TctC